MTPNIDERLASIIRALTEVVLPHLPPEASLAQEQVHLAVGHLQILRAQLDDIPAYELEELEDGVALAKALAPINGGPVTTSAQSSLQSAASAPGDDVLRRDILRDQLPQRRVAAALLVVGQAPVRAVQAGHQDRVGSVALHLSSAPRAARRSCLSTCSRTCACC